MEIQTNRPTVRI